MTYTVRHALIPNDVTDLLFRNYEVKVILISSDVIGMIFCHGTKHTSLLFYSCYSNRSVMSSYLKFEKSMAYTVCHTPLEL